MEECTTGITITQTSEECGGNYTSTNCIATPNSITYLDLSAGASQTSINAAIVSALMRKDEQISEIPEPNGSETKITEGDNITITGSGTIANPYVINSTGGEGAVQDLQSVLNAGGYAEANVDNYLDVTLDVNNSLLDIFFKDTTGNESEIIQTASAISMLQATNNSMSYLTLADGKLSMNQSNSQGQTIVLFEEPTVLTNISIPAKSTSGEYTFSAYPDETYTVSTLPTGQLNDIAVVTDALSPTYLGTLTGGGAVVTPVWHNGTEWVAR